MKVGLGKQTGHSPLWNGHAAPRCICPELRSTGCGRYDVHLIWSQTGGSGAPKILTTNLAAVDPHGSFTNHWRIGAP